MMKVRTFVLIMLAGVLVLCNLVPAQSAPAQSAPAQTSPADDLLKSKGLTRQGSYSLLDTDVHLSESLRTMRLAKKALDDNTRKRQQIQAQIKDAVATMAKLNQR